MPHAQLLPPTLLLVARHFSPSSLHGVPLCDIATGTEGYAVYPQD